MLEPAQFFKCLSENIRLQATLLIQREGELFVCELMEALGDSQPKISRHLAQLRACGILEDVRRGQWVFYSLAENLPGWALNILEGAYGGSLDKVSALQKNLKSMRNRPKCC